MTTLDSRSIAEHLSTLASLLEAEAMRSNTLGLKGSREIARRAHEVRQMADQLWDANATIVLEGAGKSAAYERTGANHSMH